MLRLLYVKSVKRLDVYVVYNVIPFGTTIKCVVCHNEASFAKDGMVFQHINGFLVL